MSDYINQIILLIFLAIAAFLGAQVKALYKKYVTTEVKKSVCRTVVRFVEQIYKDIHGPEKLAKAMEKASSILAFYGITISEEELVALIEAAVNEFNKSFSKDDAVKGQHLPGIQTAEPETTESEIIATPSAEEIIADLKDIE